MTGNPHRRRRRNRYPLGALTAVLALVLAALILIAVMLTGNPGPSGPTDPGSQVSTGPTGTTITPTSTSTTAPTTTSTTAPTDPPVVKEASFTLSAIGDLLMHMPVINACASGGDYDFESVFRYLSDYIQAADYAAANLETTLSGADYVSFEGKVGYSGYPQFNCPDAIIDGAKNAGFDMVLTANNHTYDTRTTGLTRTVEVIRNKGLGYLGSKADASEPNFVIVEENGIRLALACYTYEDNADPQIEAPNGHVMTPEDALLLNTFNYSNLEQFYQEMAESLTLADAGDADAFVLFIHWGDEYQIAHNDTQKQIAQKMCDLGVDVIIGGHPHVVQPVELLTSTTDENQKTVCLYSMGNAVSNQRLGNISYVNTAHTEDGAMFSVTFSRYSDGTVILEDAQVLPLWVNLGTNQKTGRWEYNILPLDKQVENWKTRFDMTDSALVNAEASYDRTMAIVGEGMETVESYLKENIQAVEKALGVK